MKLHFGAWADRLLASNEQTVNVELGAHFYEK